MCMMIKEVDKSKVHSRTGLERVYRFSSNLYLTSALDGVGSQTHAPAAFPPRGRPQVRSGRVRKTSLPT